VFAIPGISALIIFVYTRPQEFYEFLQRVPLLYLFLAAAIVGFAVDLKLRILRPAAVPTLPWVVALMVWIIAISSVITPAETLIPRLVECSILFVLFGVTAHCVQSFRGFQLLITAVMIACMFLTIVGVHQGMAPLGCVAADEEHPGEGLPDGRSGATPDDCNGEDAEPGQSYECEHIGLFGTTSVKERVRYRGELQDPNELAVAICSGGLAMLIAFATRKRSVGYTLFATICVTLIAMVIVYSQSRGGQLVFLAVLGIFFARQLGWKGIAAGGVMGIIMLSLGGRSGEAADASTELRYEAWRAGLDMLRPNPALGVGHHEFVSHHFLTAHNAYVLVAAELGIPGMIIWMSIVYISVKTCIVALIELDKEPGAAVARVWSLAMLAAWAGLLIQMMFLSFAYHSVLWVFFGLSGALFSAIKNHKPDFTVRFGVRDLVWITLGCLMFIFVVLPLFLRTKGY
jgi:hypothetical protein